MKTKTLLQKLYIATVVSLGLILIFLGLVYLGLVIFGPAPSMSFLMSHSEFNAAFVVFVFSTLSVVQMITRGNKRRAHFLLPTWMKEPINQYYAESPKSKANRDKENLYIIITVMVALLICLLIIAATLKDETGEHMFSYLNSTLLAV